MSRWTTLGWRLLPVLLLVTILAFHLGTNWQLVTAPPSPEWSRAIPVATVEYAGSTVPAVLDSGATMIFSTTQTGITFRLVGPNARLLGEGTLALPGGSYSDLSAVGGKTTNLFWTTTSGGGKRLHHTTVSPEGVVARESTVIVEQIEGYIARSSPGGVVLLVYGKDGLALLRPAGSGWVQAGRSQPLQGTFGSLGGQVLQDGTVLAVAHMHQGDGNQQIRGLRGDIATGLAAGGLIHQFTAFSTAKPSERVLPISVGADRTHGYVFFGVERSDRGNRETIVSAWGGPLTRFDTWVPIAMPRSAQLDDRVSASDFFVPEAMPGQAEKVLAVFQAQTASRFSRNLGLVQGTFQSGKLQGFSLVQHGKGSMQPALAQGPQGVVASWVSPAGDGRNRVYLAGTAPAFLEALRGVDPALIVEATADTLFDVMSALYPIAHGMYWLLPMFGLVGLLHVLLLTWVERNPLKLFWIGIAVAVPLQIYVALTFLSLPQYRDTMPAWLATSYTPIVVYVGIGMILLVRQLRSRLPGRQIGAMIPLASWGLWTLILGAMLFGPFIRRG